MIRIISKVVKNEVENKTQRVTTWYLFGLIPICQKISDGTKSYND